MKPRAQERAADHAYYRSQHICPYCRTRPAPPNFVSCDFCRAKARAARLERRKDAAAKGRCGRCGKTKTRKGYKICSSCRDRHNVLRRARIAARRAELQCSCGREIEFAREGKKTCERCAAQHRAAARARREARRRRRPQRAMEASAGREAGA